MGSEDRLQVALIGLGSRGYKTWFECLRESSSISISAARLCYCNRLHADCIRQLAAAGVPVLREKPVANSEADFEELCRSNTTVGVVFQRRWQARYIHLKSFLPLVGRILSVRATLAGQYDPP
ncbi:NADP(+) coupled glycerol dehydrogenase [Penicillium brevicompactum]|uniref:NADP(+) coupled glycerol dehydrogenase n=1 Tax=Penicillium brevicompactum TaxID=5074 RepID=A0A9W9UTC6_PENBR|nr:NADP(+) coupled glycerol dehydrogenase [Penicillium brevicompactum]